jgi:hypothetical protein
MLATGCNARLFLYSESGQSECTNYIFKFERLTLNVIKLDFLTSVGTSIGVQPLGNGQEEE